MSISSLIYPEILPLKYSDQVGLVVHAVRVKRTLNRNHRSLLMSQLITDTSSFVPPALPLHMQRRAVDQPALGMQCNALGVEDKSSEHT
jgi:hypothetical protein